MYVVCICTCMQAHGSQSLGGVSSFTSHLIFLKHYFPLNLELTDSLRLVGQQAGILRVAIIISFFTWRNGLRSSCFHGKLFLTESPPQARMVFSIVSVCSQYRLNIIQTWSLNYILIPIFPLLLIAACWEVFHKWNYLTIGADST